MTSLNPISQTLLIPLYFRALETQRADKGGEAILYDSYAKALIEQIPYDYAKFDSGRFSRVGCCVRAAYFDSKVESFIATHENAVVILGGCGLDTRFERLCSRHRAQPIPHFESATFYEIDLPEVIALRKSLIPQSARDIYIAASLLDTAWVEEITKAHNNASFIVVIEGVAMYLNRAELREMFESLCVLGHFELWLDVVGSMFAKQKIQHDTLKNMEATFRSGVDSPRELIEIFCPKSSKSNPPHSLAESNHLDSMSTGSNECEAESSAHSLQAGNMCHSITIIQSNLYMRNHPLRWGLLGMLIALLPKNVQMKFSFMCGLAIKAQ